MRSNTICRYAFLLSSKINIIITQFWNNNVQKIKVIIFLSFELKFKLEQLLLTF